MDKFKIISNGGADIDLIVQAEDMKIICNGGSDIKISGKANTLNITSNGGSDVDANKLLANHVKVYANAGSEVTVHADSILEARANRSSEISYSGNAKSVDVRTNGGSSVNHL